MIAFGLLLLAVAAVVALVGVLANTGSGHALNSDFTLFGYHVHGATGQLLLIGVIVGAVGMLGLNMLLAGIGRGFTRRVSGRRELKRTRRQADSLHEERDTLAHRLEQERIARARTEAEQAAGHAPAGHIAYPAEPPELAQPAGVQQGAAQPGPARSGSAPSWPEASPQPGVCRRLLKH